MSADLTRPDWDLWFIRQAYVVAQRGSCRRKRVGCIIADPDHRQVASGYNGAPTGMADCLTIGCDVRVIDGRESCVRTLHAESNAIDYAGRDACGCTLYTTVIPCRLCAQRIVQASISDVIYHEYYESQGTKDVIAYLKEAGVNLFRLDVPDNTVQGQFWPYLENPFRGPLLEA